MAENHDYQALEWVKGEIEETLKQAQQSLEAFVENPEDSTRMRFCLTHLHQVYGTLQMVEFYGAALLAEEMENLAQALFQGRVARVEDAQEVLMRAILQLPAYLDRVKEGKRDMPVVILPLLNDLRASRGESLLSETALFKPDMAAGEQAAPSEDVSAEVVKQLPQLLKKIRQLFQFALAGVIRGQEMPTNLGYLAKALAKLEQIYSNAPMAQLWWVSGAVVEGLSRSSIELSTSVKMLLGLIDKHLKTSIDENRSRDEECPSELVKNLLYYVARCDGDSPRINAVKKAFRLEDALPTDDLLDVERKRLAGPDREAVVTVIGALLEELGIIKENMDLFLRGQGREIDDLRKLVPNLKQVGDTLGVLGIGNPRRVILEQLDVIGRVVDSGILPDDNTFMDVAGALLYVEATLQGIADDGNRSLSAAGDGDLSGTDQFVSPEHVSKARAAVIEESRAGLENAKDAIMEYLSSQFNADALAPVPDILNSVRGGLVMVPLNHPADLLLSCVNYIQEHLIGADTQPEWRELDTLADAITSIEYYLERLGDQLPGDEDILAIAEEAVASLGYPVERKTEEELLEQEGASELTAEVTLDQVEVNDNVPAIEIPELSDSVTAESEPPQESIPVLDDEPVGEESTQVSEEIEVAQEPEPVEEEEDDLIDDELIEIFVEEAGEVLETINEFLPQWRQNHESEEALAEVRRAYHTLKGSGRMVGAMVVGELGWSVENMLNRIIDNSVPTNDAVIGIVETVTGVIPELVKNFEERTKPTLNVEALAAVADALAKGETPPPLPENLHLGEAPLAQEAEPEDALAEEALPEENSAPEDLSEGVSEESPEEEFSLELEIEEEPEATLQFEETIPDEALLDAGEAELELTLEDESSAEALEEIDEAEEPTAAAMLTGEASDVESLELAEEANELEIDPVLIDIFKQEALSHLEEVKGFLNAKESVISNPLLRALHTLKGSAHMAGIEPIADIAAPTEKLIKECHLQGIKADNDIHEFLGEAVSLIENGLEQILTAPNAPILGSDLLLEHIQTLRQQKLTYAEELAEGQEGNKPDPQLVSVFLAEGTGLILDASEVLNHWESNPVPGEELDNLRQELRILGRSATAAQLSDVAALCMGMEEVYDGIADGLITPNTDFFQVAHRAHEHLIGMMDRIAVGQTPAAVDGIVADLQALTDQAPEVAEQIDDAAATGEAVSDALSEQEEALDSLSEELVFESADDATSEDFSSDDVDELEDEITAAEASVESASAAIEVDSDYDPELVEIFLEEANDIVDSISNLLQEWIEDPSNLDKVAELQRDLHTLKGGARMSEMKEVGDLAHELENLYEGLCEHRFQAVPALFDVLHSCHDTLADMVEKIQANEPLEPAVGLIDIITKFMKTGVLEGAAPVAQPADVTSAESNEDVAQFETDEAANEAPMLSEPESQHEDEDALEALSAGDGEEIDTEILEVFLDEADDLADSLDETIHAWLGDRENREHMDELKRLLHTLKGGARLAGLTKLGDISHDFETDLIHADSDGVPLDDVFFAKVQATHDALFEQINAVRKRGGELVGQTTATAEPEAPQPQVAQQEVPEAPAPVVENNVVPITPQPTPSEIEQESLESFIVKDAAIPGDSVDLSKDSKGSTGESVRVTAELLEELVNLAGETSIIRGRMETELVDFAFVIDEIGQTVDRVRELLRRLDLETEAQILHRHQKDAEESGQEYEDFDPLEMDRYSTLNQLSRSLGESASDLIDLTDSLRDRSRDTETLLLQQSRVNTELQEGLMRTRMVPFSRTVPRLRRIIRQIGTETGKKAELEIIGAEGEMDRTVMDRMVAPLEHMLRNAVDHGLETPEERLAKGKKDVGRITLHLAREGGDVVLRLSDDGKGINLEGVKKRAIERGLMKPDAPLSDKEVMQFIFRPGFSTAEKVTQISGRGVGMDVVHSEIKQLGGSLKIHSAPDAGSQFTIRLPFTVSVNRALMVRVGEDAYAIPLNNIEGIVRVSPYELEAYYQPDAPAFEYAGSQYRMKYLGGFVHGVNIPQLQGHTKPLPVLLVRGAEHTMALQVDSLIGSREIVVKSVGPQLSAVSGISGATILGDGSVVIILDLMAMIRAEQAQITAGVYEEGMDGNTQEELDRTPLVMVVDDSVTVRKVTTRLLERNGYDVVTAKDGVDAITQLQEIKPDCMLLDIEMPRMDGFEVATLVRHDERLQSTPIIMITSRTGEKHKERAMGIGVNEYMGKPYQETVLLETIQSLVHQKVT
ncbi:MAG: Hpt domain-containing protein [Pseudomonadales bacterium]|nr:Hpt domain-containing protein [Pseudomonadales bacterium]